MARTAMTGSMKKGKGKREIKKSPPKKERNSFSIRKPNITQSQPSKKKTNTNKLVFKEIKFYQKSTNFLVSKTPFIRFVREIVKSIAKNSNTEIPRFTAQSLDVLQDVFESHITALAEASYLASRHAKRVTLYPSDIKLINKIKGCINL